MVNQLRVEAIVAQIPRARVSSAARKRKLQAAVVFLATVVSLVTGVVGFISAYQIPDKQNFVVGLLLCAGMLLFVRVLRWRRTFNTVVPYVPAQNEIEIGDSFATRLAPRVRVSPTARRVAGMLRRLDALAWGVLVSALVLSAGAIFVLSAFGLFNALQNELRVIDLIMVIGMVRPFRSMVTGISKIRKQDAATRRHAQTFTKSFYYAVESFHLYVDKLSQSTAGVLQASSSAANKLSVGLATTASTVVVSVAVSGMGLASAQVAPQAIIATGEVIPLPPAVVEFTGPEGREVTIRGAVFYGCVGTLLDPAKPVDAQCQTAVQEAADACATWDGGVLPPACANALTDVPPVVMQSIESTVPVQPAPPPDKSDGATNNANTPPKPATNVQQGIGTTQVPARVIQASTVVPTQTPAPCDAAAEGRPCPQERTPENPAQDDRGSNALPPLDGTPGRPPRPEGTPDGPPPLDGTPGRPPRLEGTPDGPPPLDGTPGRPPRPEGTPDGPPPLDGTPGPLPTAEGTPGVPPPPLDGTPSQPPRPEGPPGGPPPQATNVPPPRATDVPPPRATDVPPPRATDVPPPRATDVPPPRATDVPPPRATDVPPPRATDVPPPRATDVPPPRATDVPKPTRRPPP